MSIINRLKEPSTMAGFAALLAVFGVPAADQVVSNAAGILAGLTGLASIFMQEKGRG